jgi:putative membrane protein
MGLANLVPGISGGTMLLAAGVYQAFIESIAEITTLRIRVRPLVLLGTIATSAVLAILFLAGIVKELVVEQRWVMYSLFIGLTLGGVPLVWRLARPGSAAVAGGGVLGFSLMLLMAAAPGSAGGAGEASLALLFLSGLAGAAAMILPGVSGGYLLLLLGQYVAILSAVDALKVAALGDGGLAALSEPLRVLVPVGLGVVTGVVGVSNLLRWLLHRFEKATLGALLGLLLGAVVGLWPFQQGVPPEGEAAGAGEQLDPEDWPVELFAPSGAQALGSLALVLAGLGATLAIDRLGGGRGRDAEGGPPDPSEPRSS